MNEKLKNEITDKISDSIFQMIDAAIGDFTLNNYYERESEIDFIELRESILLRILKLK